MKNESDKQHEVTLLRPKAGMLYIVDREIGKRIFSKKPLIFGKITIQGNAVDTETGIKNIKVYIDGTLKATLTNIPFSWVWKEKAFFKHTISVIASDNAGNMKTVQIFGDKFL